MGAQGFDQFEIYLLAYMFLTDIKKRQSLSKNFVGKSKFLAPYELSSPSPYEFPSPCPYECSHLRALTAIYRPTHSVRVMSIIFFLKVRHWRRFIHRSRRTAGYDGENRCTPNVLRLKEHDQRSRRRSGWQDLLP